MLGLLHRRGHGEFVMRANDVEYFAPARFDDEIEVFVRVARIGRTSVTFEFAAYRVRGRRADGHGASDARLRRSRRAAGPCPCPDDYRARVLEFEGGDAEA